MIGSSSGLGFGVAFQLKDDFSKTSKQIEHSMSSLENTTTNLESSVDSALNTMSVGMTTLAASAALLLPIIIGLGKAAAMEQTEIAFSTMLKNANTAKKLIQELRHFADITPFVDEDIISSGKMLVAFGKNAKEIVPTLKLLGNVASGVGMRMSDLAELYGKNLMQPNLQSRDIWQMTNRGIPIIQALAKVMGVAKESIMDLVKDGKVGIEEMEKAFVVMGSAGGQFDGLMEKQSKAFKGRLSTMKSYLSQFVEYIGKAILPLGKYFIELGTKFADVLRKIVQTKAGIFIVKLVTGLGLLLAVLGSGLLLTGLFRFSVMKMALAFNAQAKAQILATMASKGYTAGLLAMGKAVTITLLPMLKFLAIAGLIYAVGKKLQWWEKLGKIFKGFYEIWSSFDGESFSLSAATIGELRASNLLKTVVNLGTYVVRLKSMFSGLLSAIGNAFEGVSTVVNGFIGMITEFLNLFSLEIGKNKSSLDTWRISGELLGYVIVGVLTKMTLAMFKLSAASKMSLGVLGLAFILWEKGGKWGKILAGIIAGVTVAIWAWNVAQWALNAAMYANPIVWIIGLIVACIAVIALIVWGIYELIDLIVRNWDTIVDWFKGIWEWIVNVWNATKNWVSDAWNAGVDFVKNLWKGIKSIWNKMVDWVSSKFTALINSIKKAINSVANFFGADDVFTLSENKSVTVKNDYQDRVGSSDVITARAMGWYPQYTQPESTEEDDFRPIAINLNVDGETIAEVVADRDSINRGRGGTYD